MNITFKCRNDKNIIIPYDEFKFMDNFFLKTLILDCKEDTKPIQLYEDDNIVQSIIDSIRLKKLIYNDGANLIYMLALCEKWCVPNWLLYSLNNELKTDKITSMIQNYETILTGNIKKCTRCMAGFSIHENTNTSCRTHKCFFDNTQNKYSCCGGSNVNQNFCIVGYHIPELTALSYHIHFMNNLKDLLNISNP